MPKPKVDKICTICGKKFQVKQHISDRGNGRFCSQDCLSKSRIKRVECVCSVCNKKFKIISSYHKKGGGKFCSHKCEGLSKRNRVTNKCLICGKQFTASAYSVNNGKGKYCSSKCFYSHYSGDRHHAWKGGITSDTVNIRTSPEYKQWRKSVLIRDNFTCQDCGAENVAVNAHHIKSFSIMYNEMKDSFPLLKPEDAFKLYKPMLSLSNGKTLCIPCHDKAHGRKTSGR